MRSPGRGESESISTSDGLTYQNQQSSQHEIQKAPSLLEIAKATFIN